MNNSSAVGMRFSVKALVDNCIVYDNNSGGDNWSYDTTGTGSNTVWTNSCTTPLPSGPNDTGNISADPQFVNSSAGNFRLRRSSPCVNAGVNRAWMTGTVDLDGAPRLVGTVDMGAYELAPPRGTVVTVK